MSSTATPSKAVTISEADFDRFRDFFYRKTGISFESKKRYFVDKRLLERVEKTGNDSFRSYFTKLRFQSSGDELQELVNLMTVNETYFFRESHQFDCLVTSVLDELIKFKSPGDPVRIWSIPSSTGEEPYSIALYLLENWSHINDMDVEIVSSDIDTNVLKRCQEGVYGRRSVQHLPKRILTKYFTRKGGGEFQLTEDIRDAIQFTQLNLADASATKHYRGFDVVFCRNLLIYFDDVSRRQAAEVFFDALNPGGFVFLGHSESMSRISSLFNVRKFKDALAYQRPLRG